MVHEAPESYPFWTEPQAELGLIRIGLSEAFLETIEEELVGLEWLVIHSVARKGDTLALLHTAHRALELRAPFAMQVVAINDEVVQDSRLLRISPYYEGWLAEVRRAA